jgi:diguanylate cyclase (GGDEF)-like protein
MLPHLSATDIAFAMIAVMQGVLCGVWLLGAWVIGDVRRAAQHWAAFAGLSSLSFVALATALHLPVPSPGEHLRAVGNLCGVAAMIALHRGIRLFVDRPLPNRAYALAVCVAVVASWLGVSPGYATLRVSAMSTVLLLLALGTAADLHRYGRDVVRRPYAWLLSLPLLAAAAGFAVRGVRALLRPESVATEMIADSALNVGSALAYVVIALAFHAALMGVVFGRLLADLRHRSRHDGLTGLLNRRAIEEALLAQVQRSRRSGEPFSVLMLDLDHFKDINDRHGHAMGDRALKHTAAALKAEVREIDTVGRFGGEEFLVLMPGATVDTARPVAERLRGALARDVSQADALPQPLSASIGIAQWREPAEEPSRLLMRADAALYAAKLRGRNCVVAEAPEEMPNATWVADGR